MLTPRLSRSFGFGNLEGLLIGGVDAGSGAGAADLDSGMLITSIDGQSTSTIVSAGKVLYSKKKGEKAKFELVFPRRRGPFVEYRQGTVEISVQ